MERELKRVDTIARVRRAFHVQGWSVKKISRELHVSRNKVRKILRSDQTDFAYEPELPRLDEPWVTPAIDGFADEVQTPFIFEQERDRVTQLSSRIVRNRLFRRLVLQAYNKRCAITGLKLINGGGRAEVDAAHIRPVEASRPDIFSNGIALSGTAHRMFDRGLIGLSDNFDILISRQANDPDSIQGLLNKTGRAIVPGRVFQRPHPQFLRWHRDNCFKR